MSDDDLVSDIGVNFSSKQFKGYHDVYLNHAYDAYIESIVCISNSRAEWDSNVELILEHKDQPVKLYTTIGIHPHNAKSCAGTGDETFTEMLSYLKNSSVVAIGECGLDFNRMFSTREQQIAVFKRHLDMAESTGMPLYLHDREASTDMIQLLSERKDLHGVVHCFTGNKSVMHAYLDMGFHIGITGWICDTRRNKDLLDAVKELPLNRLLIETDAPWLTPLEYTKEFGTKRNESDALEYVVKAISKYTGHSIGDIKRASRKNAQELFGKHSGSENSEKSSQPVPQESKSPSDKGHLTL